MERMGGCSGEEIFFVSDGGCDWRRAGWRHGNEGTFPFVCFFFSQLLLLLGSLVALFIHARTELEEDIPSSFSSLPALLCSCTLCHPLLSVSFFSRFICARWRLFLFSPFSRLREDRCALRLSKSLSSVPFQLSFSEFFLLFLSFSPLLFASFSL
jgi:hypothetical protein